MVNGGEEFTLVIESAIRGGSIALLRDGSAFAEFVGDSDLSRSEDLLPNISKMLASAGIDKTELSRIVVSRGSGSFTGLRIGLATAMGLGESLGITVDGASLFDALFLLGEPGEHMLAAVPMGRNDVAWQSASSGSGERSQPRSERSERFFALVEKEKDRQFIMHAYLVPMMNAAGFSKQRLINAGHNLAGVIGTALYSGKLSDSGLDPIYLANSAYRA